MINDLNLSSNKLIIFSIIHGFSKKGGVFSGSLKYLTKSTGSSKSTILRCLGQLVKSGAITKSLFSIQGTRYVKYKSNFNDLGKRVKTPTNNLNWYEDYQEYLKSDLWKSFREVVLKRAKNTCQKCKNQFHRGVLHVHHLHYKTLGNEGFEDVLLVCKPCHEKIHNKPIN